MNTDKLMLKKWICFDFPKETIGKETFYLRVFSITIEQEKNCRFLERIQKELTHKIKLNDNG